MLTTLDHRSRYIQELFIATNRLERNDILVPRVGGNSSVKVFADEGNDVEDVALLVRSSGPYLSNPAPSVESRTHASIRAPFVLRTDAEGVQTITDTEKAVELVEKIGSEYALLVQHTSAGVFLREAIAAELEAKPVLRANIVGAHDGLTFGDTAEEAAARHASGLHSAPHSPAPRGHKFLSTAATDESSNRIPSRRSPTCNLITENNSPPSVKQSSILENASG